MVGSGAEEEEEVMKKGRMGREIDVLGWHQLGCERGYTFGRE